MSRETFLKSVTVLDTETTDINPETAEIVEIAGARYDGQNWQVKSQLLGALNGIPPEVSAKNHISQRMINGVPVFHESITDVCDILNWPSSRYWVAHNAGYDQKVLSTAWSKSGPDYQHYGILAEDNGVWICTFRLAKALLDGDFPDMKYSLNYLRYRLDLPVSDDLSSHRAGADTLVCAVLFEFLVDYAIATGKVEDNDSLGKQLNKLCWQPAVITVWPFGKNKGKLLTELPNDYYIWALDNMDCLNENKNDYDYDLASSVAAELERRLTQ